MDTGYWCYRCNRSVNATITEETISCPDCSSGFIELIHLPQPISRSFSDSRHRRFPTAAMYLSGGPATSPRPIRRRINNITPTNNYLDNRSPFNPVIVLRGTNNFNADNVNNNNLNNNMNSFELFYDDGAGSGLRPLPSSMSEFLLGSGFDRLLDQLQQIEAGNGGNGLSLNPPASKDAIDSLPVVEITEKHVDVDDGEEGSICCAVCKEEFVVGDEVRELPCKHLYHQDCILPWLCLKNSCPVCRHELPTDGNVDEVGSGEDTVGLTIWRLPGGGFAVGRFTGGRRGGERELPVVYTEMDGGFGGGGSNGVTRRVAWGTRGGVSRERSGFRRVLSGLFACFGRSGQEASRSGVESRRGLSSVFNLNSRRRRGWGFDINDDGRW